MPAGNRRPLLVTVPFFARGGAEHTLFETLRALGDRWRPLFVSLAPHSAELGDRRDEFRQLSAHLLSLGDWVHPAAMPGILLGLIEGHGVAHWYNANGTTLFYDFAPRLRAERPSPRVIDHLYDHEIGYIDRYLQPQAGFEPQAHVDAIVAENHRIHDVLCARGWPTERVPTIWPCGRSTDAFAPEERRPAVRTALRRELGYSDDAVVVLTAARMHPQKRPLDLVALAQRLQDAPRLHWLVVGGGPLEAEMDAAIASAPAARIRRLPFRTDIPDLLLACDAGALVSAYEGLPVFFLEALQAGRPFLGTAVGDLGVLLRDTGAGWLVETPGDLDALEAAARRLLDDAERAAKGRRAAEVAPAFAVEACAERYDRAFRGAPARPSGSRTPVPTEDRPTGVLPGWTARTRAESLFWHLARGWRPAARRARRAAAILRRRVLRGEPWVVDRPTAPRPQREPGSTTHPAVLLEGAVDASVLAAHRAAQTETALVATDAPSASTAGWLWLVDGDPGDLPSAAAEAALLAATVEDLPLVLVGEGASAAAPKALLWRAPNGGRSRVDGRAGRVIARRLPLVGFEPVTASDDVEADAPRPGRRRLPLFRQAGPHWLRFDVGSRIVHRPLRDAVTSLAALPEVDGPRTALFLMPFLAVGGAERLLDDLIAGLDPASRRILIVTTEPHDRQLGQTVDRFRALTPHVYTLGDWLPRAAHAGVLRHLIRRWRVESVVSWNGTVLFYDEAVSLSRMTPRPRLLAQLYHHRGAWAARTTSAIASAIDVHLAVQPEIARALVAERGLAPKRVAVVPHGVEVPSSATDADDRRRLRAALGLPADALVLGAFVRLHPQKRPLDLVRLARRLATDDVWLLLIGGGPLEEDLEAELARRPVANLVRLPMVPDARPFYA
ncbi:MAG: glycosyltransferase, partial [Acidobacteriota bacterium]